MSRKVLVIDDDPALLALMGAALRKSGLEVFLAGNGEVGMELFETVHPDLVVTDIVMPAKEGVSLIIDIKRSLFETRLIAISGGGVRGSKDYLRWAKELGADATLHKPFRMSVLLMIVHQLIEEAQGRPCDARGPAARDEPPALDIETMARDLDGAHDALTTSNLADRR